MQTDEGFENNDVKGYLQIDAYQMENLDKKGR